MSKILRVLNIGEFNSLNNRLPLVAGMMDNKDLSRIYSDTPNRYLLAFFVPKFRLLSQSGDNKAQTHLPQFTGVNRHTYAHSVTSYGGVTLQNKPIGEYAGRFCITESEPRHPLRNFRSVALSQNHTGGHNHAY